MPVWYTAICRNDNRCATALPRAPRKNGLARCTTSVPCSSSASAMRRLGSPSRNVGYPGIGTDGTRTTGYGSSPATRAVPDAGSGAITSTWCPRSTRCSATRTTECATPLMSGGNDSETIVTRMATPCGARRCGRPHRPDALAKNALYLVRVAGPDQRDRSREARRRGLVGGPRVAPGGHQVGQQEPAGVGLGRELTGLPAGQVDARRVVRVLAPRRLAEEQVGPLGEPDDGVAGCGVARVGQRPAVVVDPYPERLHRVVDPLHGDRERADADGAGGERVEGVHVGQRPLVGAAVRGGEPLLYPGRPVHRQPRERRVRRVPADHHVGARVQY